MKKILAVIFLLTAMLCMIMPNYALAESTTDEAPVVISVIALVGMLFLAGVLIWLYKTGKITTNGISAIGGLLDQVEQIIPDGCLMDKLIRNAAEAVRAVEQLVKKGELEKTDEARKAKAVELANEYTALDNIAITNPVASALDTIIEAEVGGLPKDEKFS